MNEETQSQEKQETSQEVPKATAEDIKKGDELKPINELDRADTLLKGLKEQNDRAEQIKNENAAIVARSLLAGKTDAGSVTKTKEELQKEEVERQAKAIADRFVAPRL